MMLVRRIETSAAERSPLLVSVDRLIETVGTEAFEEELFRAAKSSLACEHLTAYDIAETGQPTLLFALDPEGRAMTQGITHRYMTSYWMLDPINDLSRFSDDLDDGIIELRSRGETSRCSYRRQCIGTSHWHRIGEKLVERISIARRYRSRTLRMSLHRPAQAEGEDAVGTLMKAADLLFPLLHRHAVDMKARPPRSRSFEDFKTAIAVQFPDMPAREADVCAGIACGMTSEAIALQIGISINTVLTYRKRAYHRLRISSQNELLRILMV